jgi:hypothetical protein
MNKIIIKETPAIWSKRYYVKNKDKLLEYSKQYYNTNRLIISEKSKEYRDINKDAITEIKKKYLSNPANMKKALDYIKNKIPCPDCGHITARANMWKHKKGRLHKKKMNE